MYIYIYKYPKNPNCTIFIGQINHPKKDVATTHRNMYLHIHGIHVRSHVRGESTRLCKFHEQTFYLGTSRDDDEEEEEATLIHDWIFTSWWF